jgi:hypothetical protein
MFKTLNKKFKVRIINYLIKHLLHALNEEDVLVVSGKDFLYKKRKLTTDEVLSLKDEATSFENSILWKLIRNDIKWSAQERMGNKAVTTDDIVFGKAMLYSINLINTFIKNIKSVE